MKNIIYLFVLAFLLIACKKEYHVSGRVYNPITGDGISGVKIRFSASELGLPGGFKEVASTFTDANGYYNLKYDGGASLVKAQGNENLYMMGNFYEGSYTPTLPLNEVKNKTVDWHAVPYGELNTHVKNINCQGVLDSMQVRMKTNFKPFTSFGDIWFTGCYEYTSTTPSKVPMGFRYYETKVILSGVTSYVQDTVFVTDTGVSFLEIEY